MQGDFAANRLMTKPFTAGSALLVFYVRTTGNDNNNGLSPATAFLTLGRALREMVLYSVNQPIAIDVTGMTIAASEVLQLGGTNLGSLSFDVAASTSPNNFSSRRNRQLRAELSLVQAVTVTNQAFNATTGLMTLTVSDALVANALRGQFAIGAATNQYGVIQGNSGGAGPNTITIARLAPAFTLPVGIYQPGATLTYGNAANANENAIYLNALADWNLQGLFIRSNGPKASSLSIWPNAPVDVTLCDVTGFDLQSGAGVVSIDGCYVHDATFRQEGATVNATQSYFRTVTFECSGSGSSGRNEWVGVMIDVSQPFGGASIAGSRYSFDLTNARIASSINEGVHALFGVSQIKNTSIESCLKSAIIARNQVSLTVDNVQGAGNVGFGVEAYYGAGVRRVNASAVTGTTNDLFVGAIGAATWAATPLTDLDQLVRVGI